MYAEQGHDLLWTMHSLSDHRSLSNFYSDLPEGRFEMTTAQMQRSSSGKDRLRSGTQKQTTGGGGWAHFMLQLNAIQLIQLQVMCGLLYVIYYPSDARERNCDRWIELGGFDLGRHCAEFDWTWGRDRLLARQGFLMGAGKEKESADGKGTRSTRPCGHKLELWLFKLKRVGCNRYV